jgi:flagellar basal-body rod protein FlgB
MDNSQTDIFDLAAQRLAWVDRRQAMLAQNVANADTPGYQAKDVTPFAQLLARATPALARTNAQHMAGPDSGGADPALRPRERAPDGNAVSIEQELTKIADTQGTQALTANLVQTYTKMFQTALGK